MLQQFNKIRFEKKILLISFTFLLILPQIVLAQITVQNSPSANDAGWPNMDGAYADGGDPANTTLANSLGTWYNYGFSIPAGSTIDEVWVRDDSWTQTAENPGIGILVSYDGGNTWTTEVTHATTTGELTYWTDVTVAGLTYENLSDTNFRVRVYSRKQGGGPDWWNLDWLPVNVTYSAPNQPPTWSTNQTDIPSTYNPTYLAEFNITWQDSETSPDVVFIEQNWTSPSGENLTMSNNTYGGSIYNYSIVLPGGTYYWKSYANDTQNAWNYSDIWTFTIGKADNPADLYFNNGTEYKNDNITITYGTQTNVTGIIQYMSGNLYRNDSDANSENNTFITLPGGSWKYTVNTSGNDNYTANSTTYFIFVNKASITVDLYLNGTQNDNKTYTYPESVNATGTSSALTPSLYRNGVYKGTDEQILLGNGTYAYKVNATGNENYTDNSTGITYYALINKGTVQPTLSINTTWSETYPTATNVSCSVTSQNNEVSCNLYRNDTGSVSNPNEVLLGVGAYNYTTNTSETANYSANTTGESRVLTIGKGTLSLSLSITPSNSVTYPTQTTADGIETNNGDSDVSYELWRNTTQVSDPETIILGANVYEYRYNATGGVNWTANATGVTDILTVSQNNTNPVNLYLNGTLNDNRTYTYPEAVNATGAMVYSNAGTALLWRDGINKANPEEILLGNGTYAYKVNTSGNDNYTANDTGITFYALVNKGDVNISLWLNGTEGNKTYTQNQIANFTALINVTGLTINLTSNYTGWVDIQNQTVIYNETTLITQGDFWNLTAFYPGGDNYSAFSRTYFFNVTSDQPPTWSSNNTNPLSPTNYTPGKNYQFNITCQDDYGVSEVILEFNGTNYSKLLGEISKDVDVYYKTLTDLSANDTGYNYKWFANDTVNQWSSTGSYWLYIINKNNSQNYMNLTINGTESNKNYIYPAGSNATGWHSIPQLTFNLYRNDTPLGNSNPVSDVNRFGVGFYIYTYNTSGNDNYTSSSKNYNLTIQKNTTNPVRLFLNDNEDNITVKYPTSTNATGIMVYSDSGTVDLFRNDSSVGNPEITTLGADVYEYRVNTTGNDNYTANSTGVVYYLTVEKGPTKMRLWLNNTQDNYTYYQNDWANFTTQVNVSGKTIKLNSSYPGWSEISNNTVIYNTTQLNILGNDYNLTAYWGGDGNYSANSQTYFFDVITNQPPQWSANDTSILNGTEYVPGRNYGFQINWTDPETSVSVVIFKFNGTNHTDVSDNGENTYWYNLTDLPAGTWNYTWYANDTQDAWGQSDRWNYTVIRVTSNASLTILPSSPIDYGTQSNATCIGDSIEADANLYRNDSLANSENNTYIILPAETWEYICNITLTQNYTSATNSSIYIVQKVDPTTNMHIAINGSEIDQIKEYPNSTNVTAWETNTNDDGCSYNLYKNDSSTSNPELLELGVGNYTYIYNTSECANYSSGSITRILNITKGFSILILSNNLSWSGTYPSASNTSGSGCPAQLTCKLYRNDTGEVSSPDEVLLKPEDYNYTFNTTGNDNYTANSTWNVLIISKGAVNISLWLNDSENNETYDIYDIANFTAQSNVSGLIVNISTNMTGWTEPSDITTVYNITNLTESGLFNITGYTQGNENYSESLRTYYATVLGAYLEMELIEPTGTKLVREGESFLLNATITCRAANCGDINITPRYGGNIINTTGVLYVNEILRNCTLNKNENCFANWTVHTTTIGTWNIDANASNSVSNETSDATLSVYRVVTEVGPGGLLPPVAIGLPPSPLLDLEITDLTPVVFAGEDLIYTINLTNVGYNETSFDVVIHKRVIKDNKILLEDAITRSMISGLLVTDSLKIPEDFQFGRYFFELYVEYEGKNASALATFDVKKSCMILSGASYDLSRKALILYTESLRNVTLRFKNNCEIELTDGILWLDGNEIEIGKISEEGFDLTVEFDKYGLHNATVSYTEGLSEIEFFVEPSKWEVVGVDIVLLAGILISIIVFSIFVLKIALPKLKERIERKKVEAPKIEYELEMFKKELKEQIIKKLKEKLEKGD